MKAPKPMNTGELPALARDLALRISPDVYQLVARIER